MREINLELGYPTVADAMNMLKKELQRCKKNEVLLFVHGYGSSGKVGKICKSARQWLKAQERNGSVSAVIFGEDFEIFNFKALELKNKEPELEGLLRVCNHGVTVVEK